MAAAELVELARREHGELLVDVLVYPSEGAAAILVGGERVAYLPNGERAPEPWEPRALRRGK